MKNSIFLIPRSELIKFIFMSLLLFAEGLGILAEDHLNIVSDIDLSLVGVQPKGNTIDRHINKFIALSVVGVLYNMLSSL